MYIAWQWIRYFLIDSMKLKTKSSDYYCTAKNKQYYSTRHQGTSLPSRQWNNHFSSGEINTLKWKKKPCKSRAISHWKLYLLRMQTKKLACDKWTLTLLKISCWIRLQCMLLVNGASTWAAWKQQAIHVIKNGNCAALFWKRKITIWCKSHILHN